MFISYYKDILIRGTLRKLSVLTKKMKYNFKTSSKNIHSREQRWIIKKKCSKAAELLLRRVRDQNNIWRLEQGEVTGGDSLSYFQVGGYSTAGVVRIIYTTQ